MEHEIIILMGSKCAGVNLKMMIRERVEKLQVHLFKWLISSFSLFWELHPAGKNGHGLCRRAPPYTSHSQHARKRQSGHLFLPVYMGCTAQGALLSVLPCNAVSCISYLKGCLFSFLLLPTKSYEIKASYNIDELQDSKLT